MNIDTEQCHNIARQFSTWQKWIYFNEFELDHRHQQIQQGLESLQLYFAEMARQAEQVEEAIHPHSQSYWKVNHHFTPISNFLGKKSAFSMGASCIYHAHHSVRQNEHASLTTNVGNFQASGTCQAGIWKEQKFDPNLKMQIQSQASLLHATATTKLGGNKVYFETKETAKVGVVVAKAEAILNKEEQTIGFHIGLLLLGHSLQYEIRLFVLLCSGWLRL